MKAKHTITSLVIAAILAITINDISYSEHSDIELSNIEALSNYEHPNDPHLEKVPARMFECGAKIVNGYTCSNIIVLCVGGGHGCKERLCPIHN